MNELETRQRLLEAAGAVFAEHGFHHATVRQICAAAGANLAAVNYHFRNKQGLYGAVLQYWHELAVRKYPPTLGLGPHPTPRQRLHAFVRSFLYRILDEDRPAWHGKLMAHEIADPTSAIDPLIENMIRPLFENLCATIQMLLRPGATPEKVRLAAFSVVGQCLFYNHARPVIQRMHPDQAFAPRDIDHLAEHITSFSMAGLRTVAPVKARPRERKPGRS